MEKLPSDPSAQNDTTNTQKDSLIEPKPKPKKRKVILEDKSIIYSKSKLPNNDQQASKQEMIDIVEKQLKIRTIDISFLISKMNQEFSLNNQFVGSADTNRIGIFGHSFGGCTSVMSAFNDNRIDAVLGLDAYFLPLSELSLIHI